MPEKIIVTGVTGFIGPKIVEKLPEDYEIHVIERYVTGRYTFDGGKRIYTHYANFTDYPAIRQIIKEVQPDYCIHLGALSAVSFSYDHFMEVSETNYNGTINLAEACHREVPHFKQFIFAGTSEEYGMTLNDKNSFLNEESGLSPNSPYAVAKVACDFYLKYMGMAYGFPYTILRPFNTYGRENNKHFFIERTISQMLARGTVRLGDPDSIRDWLYVDDHVDGYIKALGNEKALGQTIQLATGKGYTTKETAELIAKLTGFDGKIEWHSTPPRPLDAKVLIGDSSKARGILGWESKVSLEEGLRRTIKLYSGK